MGVISTEMYEALLSAKVPEDKARAAAAEVARGQDLVSKTDLFEFGVQLRADMDRRFSDIDGRFSDIDGRFANIDGRFAEMERRIAEMERRIAEMERRFAEMDKRLDGMDKRLAKVDESLAVLKFAVFSGGPVLLGLLVKLVFFP